MRTPLHPAVAALAITVATGSGAATADTVVHPVTTTTVVQPDCPLPPVESSSGAFGAGLLAAASEDGARNALVSPLGIGVVLEMLVPGAKSPVRRSIRDMLGMGGDGPERAGDGTDGTSSAGGDTLAAGPDGSGPAGGLSCRLAWVLYDASDDAVKVRVANGAFANRRLDLFPAYSETLRAAFDARVERLDFTDERSVERINAWVSEATEGTIPRLVSRLDPDDVLVLANAMRFEGGWAQPFDPERTVPAPFRLRSGTAPEIPTMHADDLPARYREDGDFQAVALPYDGGRFEFVAVLPRAGLDAPEALRRLVADPSWLGGRGFRRSRGALALPRLVLDAETSLLPALRALGLGAALDDPQAFAGIAAPAPKLSRVLHRTMLVLDERGTEAAAATAAVMTTRAAVVEEERSFEMRVDRPFALAVRHRGTGAVLFTAWVDDPVRG